MHLNYMGAFGKVEVVPEHMIDAVVAVKRKFSGICLYADRGDGRRSSCGGMPRAQAYEFACTGSLWKCKNGLEPKASRRTERYGLLSGGNDDRSGPCPGTKRFPECSDRSRKGMCRGFKKFVESDLREDW